MRESFGAKQHAPRHLEVLPAGQVRIERRRFNQGANSTHQVASILCERLSVQKDAATVWTEQAQQKLDGGRFPGAIRAKEAVDGAARYAKIHPVHGLTSPECTCEVLRLYGELIVHEQLFRLDMKC
jgi:hypothetical protein